MKLIQFIFILAILCWASMDWAQVPEESSAAPEQWQMSLDMIKAKAQTLLVQNNGLQDENHQLQTQLTQLQRLVVQQQNKNEQLAEFLKQRHGRTDQQMQIATLTQSLRVKRQQLRTLEAEWGMWKRKLAHQPKGIAPKPWPPLPTVNNDQLALWRNQLDEQKGQELFLANELDALKKGTSNQNANMETIEQNNKRLEARWDQLRLRKLQHMKEISDRLQPNSAKQQYELLKERKDQLEADISAYEARLDELKPASVMDLSWGLRKKAMVHQMVVVDARNNQMRQQVRELREDINILQDQINSMQQRLNASGGQDQIINP